MKRQRVAAQVLLMDEPLSNLDAMLHNQMRAEIIKLCEKINTTVIYVIHDRTEAMTLGVPSTSSGAMPVSPVRLMFPK